MASAEAAAQATAATTGWTIFCPNIGSVYTGGNGEMKLSDGSVISGNSKVTGLKNISSITRHKGTGPSITTGTKLSECIFIATVDSKTNDLVKSQWVGKPTVYMVLNGKRIESGAPGSGIGYKKITIKKERIWCDGVFLGLIRNVAPKLYHEYVIDTRRDQGLWPHVEGVGLIAAPVAAATERKRTTIKTNNTNGWRWHQKLHKGQRIEVNIPDTPMFEGIVSDETPMGFPDVPVDAATTDVLYISQGVRAVAWRCEVDETMHWFYAVDGVSKPIDAFEFTIVE